MYGYEFCQLNQDYPLPYKWEYEPNMDNDLFTRYKFAYCTLQKLEPKIPMLKQANVKKSDKLVEPRIVLPPEKISGKFFSVVDDLNKQEGDIT